MAISLRGAAQLGAGCTCFCVIFVILSFLDFVSLLSERPCAKGSPGCGSEFDLRVTKGFGTKGYNQVRVSVISTNATAPGDGFFSYSARFMYKWRENHLHSTMVTVEKDGSATILPGVLDVKVRLPPQGAGVAGVLIADPCVVSNYGRVWVPCPLGRKFNTIERIPALLNAFVGDESTDFWGILGDNWYDRTGQITADAMSRISPKVKSKVFYAVPGNHDFWAYGNAWLGSVSDQCGNAFMQYYIQDAKAAEFAEGAVPPFDFSIDPDERRLLKWGCNIPNYTNFFWYNQIGNVGLVGQSGAHTWAESKEFMQEACTWLAEQGPSLQLALLVGHWDESGMGAVDDMAMPQFFERVRLLPGCKEFDERGMLRFVTGHTHCNTPHPHNSTRGYRVAGAGMYNDDCTGSSFGIPILDTTAHRVRWWYFDTSTDDLYNQTITCVRELGWRGCTEKLNTTLWLDLPLSPNATELFE